MTLTLERLREHPDFLLLVRRKQRLAWTLTSLLLLAYYGFVLLVAFAPGLLGQPLNGGVTSLGMLLGVALIVFAVLLTGIYVRHTNKVLDPLNDRLKREVLE
ncbi:DUF485 domain-containing protein [Pseudomonas citronellolis]|uniref:DUF485 domain-containing protein n=1 Tax=Pseudomonas citronellolis TaxID=53408 RepID=UPI0023E3A000|nr:DUF485 domain-containing protein [Pseudomonas citronellolis]MDF3936550.1 DUF485 domain-containing protein [Pseudomonas citronellolis]